MFRNEICVPSILMCLVFQGCHPFQNSEQQTWHDKIERTYQVVESAAEENVLVSKEQLVALVGDPDLRLSPPEFEKLLPPDEGYRKRTMEHIWFGYCLAKRDTGQLKCDPQRDNWRNCEHFEKSSLWLYDESAHFEKPLDHNDWLHCLFCGKPAFVSFFFFVENENVIGWVPLVHYEPMRTLLTKRSEK